MLAARRSGAEPALGAGRPPRPRRRPVLLAGSVAAVCAGALVSVWAYTSTSAAVPVVAARVTVHRGEVLTAADLMTVRVGVDPALHPLPASGLEALVGQRAALDLAAGSLLTAEAVTAAVVPMAGESVVGVSVTAGMVPAEPLLAGDRVRVVATPGQQGEPGTGRAPATVAGSVVGVRDGVDGQLVVDVAVPFGDAAGVAAWAATGRAALVLDSRER